MTTPKKLGSFWMKNGTIVQLIEVSFNEARGNIYGVAYISPRDESYANGGSSFWWDDNDLHPILDALLRLRLEKYRLEIRQRKRLRQLTAIKNKIARLGYAIGVAAQSGEGDARE